MTDLPHGVDCGFPEVAALLPACLAQAGKQLSPAGVHAYLLTARTFGRMGRGAGPALAFLRHWPAMAGHVGEAALPAVAQAVQALTRSPNGRAIEPFLESLAEVAPRLSEPGQFQGYMDLCLDAMQRTSESIHGVHKTYASAGLISLLEQAPRLLRLLTLDGLRHWVDYGIRNHARHPQHQRAYFLLQSADSLAVMQSQRHGTPLKTHTRALDLYLRCLWQDADLLLPYRTDVDNDGALLPYYDPSGIFLPDVYDTHQGVSGLDRYRATLAHMAAHRRWSTPLHADNLSPQQRLAVEMFEDARVDLLAARQFPGLRHIFSILHPRPVEGACDPARHSCLRHRLAMLSAALLDPAHGYTDRHLLQFTDRFTGLLAQGEANTGAMAELAIAYITQTRLQSDQLPSVFWTDTANGYRDDNRHLWKYHEYSDDEDQFARPSHTPQSPDAPGLPPQLYPEWDYTDASYRPDWVSVHARLHPSGNASTINRMLDKHRALAKRLQRQLEQLKPQDRARLRYQEEGDELDLDIACQSLIELKSGLQPDPRINQGTRTDGRSIAVLLLLDLSESLSARIGDSRQSILELSQEAVALLAWSISQVGDPFAIAGFHSNTRHAVQYLHIKGFEERWDDPVKARLAATEAAYSTRMGAAMRHAAHCLGAQQADKKLLLVLTDGQPADVDCPDPRQLINDARQAVRELDQSGVFSYCINLDANADAYVADIFGHRYTVMDHIERLPEQLPKLFMALTR